ncbi:MAG: hypothetical protein ACI7YS_08350 [Flavobacterium sp.]
MKKIHSLIALSLFGLSAASAQEISFGHIQNRMARDKDGINQFDVKKDSVEFKGLSAYIGGAFAMQFQALNSFNDQKAGTYPASGSIKAVENYRLNDLENQFNLPAANMSFGAQLADGVRVNMDLYLSARHHNETWVKGGYLQIDKLDFIKKDFMAGLMKYTTIKIGQMENNYGDAHFRRTDNGNAMMNPFIDGNIMDSFQTDMGAEVYYNRGGLVSMLGITNGKLNQSVAEIVPKAPGQNTTISPTFLAKLGYDKQLDKDLRVRFTGSLNYNANMSSNPWSSDRAGARYFGVMSHQAYTYGGVAVPNNFDPTANATTGRFNPGFGNWYSGLMFNPFVKFQGLEFFGTAEFAQGGNKAGDETARHITQFVGDVVYRFGNTEQFYLGGRYGTVSGKLSNADAEAVNVNRLEASAGWFMTKNILAKLAYTNQTYGNYTQTAAGNTQLNDLYGGSFSGLMFEAVIAF